MDHPGRRYLCAGCRTVVLICSHCDRGHRYCTTACAEDARHRAQRVAGSRYQASLRGRHAHAQRQRRYRAKAQKVTHQGSPPEAPPAQLAPELTAPANRTPWHCWHCRHALPEWVRLDFLRSSVRRTQTHRSVNGPYPRN